MGRKQYEFDAVIQKVPDIDGAYVEFPYDVRGSRKGAGEDKRLFDGVPMRAAWCAWARRTYHRPAEGHPRQNRQGPRGTGST